MGITVERKIVVLLLSILIQILLIIVEVLLHTCTLDYILNFSSFLKYLATNLQTNIVNFLLPFWFGITDNKDFPESPWKRLYQVLFINTWQPTFRDLNFGGISHNWRKLNLASGPVPVLEVSTSNWWGWEVADIKADCFLPR